MFTQIILASLVLSQEVKLLSPQPSSAALFGHGATLRGDWALVGAYASGQPTFGNSYVFQAGDTWLNPPAEELIQPEPQHHGFGAGVALALDFAYVGAPGDDKFAPEVGIVYEFSPPDPNAPMAKWKASASLSAGKAGDKFGHAIGVSEDGTVLVVGGPSADVDGLEDSGSAIVFTKSGGVWQEPGFVLPHPSPAKEMSFGYSVAASPDGNLVAAATCHPDANMGSHVSIFERAGDTWDLLNTVTGNPQGEGFGCALALADDGTLVVGAIYAGSQHGAVYVCEDTHLENSASCTKLETPSSVNGSALLGISVALEGDVIVAGAASDAIDGDGTKAGDFYVYLKEDTVWISNPAPYLASDGAHDDKFGEQIALSGPTVLVGAYSHDPFGILDAGAAYIYSFGRRDDVCDGENPCFSGCCKPDGKCGGVSECKDPGETTGGGSTGGGSTGGGGSAGEGTLTAGTSGGAPTSGDITGATTDPQDTGETNYCDNGADHCIPEKPSCDCDSDGGRPTEGVLLGLVLVGFWRRKGVRGCAKSNWLSRRFGG